VAKIRKYVSAVNSVRVATDKLREDRDVSDKRDGLAAQTADLTKSDLRRGKFITPSTKENKNRSQTVTSWKKVKENLGCAFVFHSVRAPLKIDSFRELQLV
jgi:hypothetical protein